MSRGNLLEIIPADLLDTQKKLIIVQMTKHYSLSSDIVLQSLTQQLVFLFSSQLAVLSGS